MTITLYGIKNCDSVKKARKWMEQQQLAYQFHDFRTDGISQEWLANIETKVGWDLLLNKRSTTFRQLDESVKNTLCKQSALELMYQNPTLIKRPVTESEAVTLVGFKPDVFAEAFNS